MIAATKPTAIETHNGQPVANATNAHTMIPMTLDTIPEVDPVLWTAIQLR